MKKKIAVDYYRKITVSLPQALSKKRPSKASIKKYYTQYYLYFLAVLAILLGLFIVFEYINLENIKSRRARVVEDLSYWEAVAAKHPNSPDAFYNAALDSAKLGDKIKAAELLENALKLDPSFDKACGKDTVILR